MRILAASLALLLALPMASCDLFESETGSFELTLSGALDARITGEARYPQPSSCLSLYLSDADGDNALRIVQRCTGEPESVEVGTSEVGTDGAFGALFERTSGPLESYVATGGTLTVTSVDARHLSGRFDITAERGDGPGGETLRLEGTFDAVGFSSLH